MKKQLLFLIITLVFITHTSISNAQSIFVFDVISPSQVSAGKIVINNSSIPTPVTFDIVATTARDINTGGPFVCDMVITLVYEKNGVVEEISDPQTISHNNYSATYLRTDPLRFTGELPANRIGGVIRLKYSCFDYVTSQTTKLAKFSTASYQTVSPQVVPPGTIDWINPANAKFISVSASGRNIFNAGTTVLTNGVYHLEFQSDGNLVLYNGGTPIWASGKRRGNNSTQVRFLPSGIGCYEGNTNYYWISWAPRPIGEAPGAIWVLQDDGNFVCYRDHQIDSNGVIIPQYDYAIGATMTQGGQKSSRSGRIN